MDAGDVGNETKITAQFFDQWKNNVGKPKARVVNQNSELIDTDFLPDEGDVKVVITRNDDKNVSVKWGDTWLLEDKPCDDVINNIKIDFRTHKSLQDDQDFDFGSIELDDLEIVDMSQTEDQFILGGEELVEVQGADDDSDVTEYYTKKESFSRVRHFTGSGSNSHWEVTESNGVKYRYGSNNDSRNRSVGKRRKSSTMGIRQSHGYKRKLFQSVLLGIPRDRILLSG